MFTKNNWPTQLVLIVILILCLAACVTVAPVSNPVKLPDAATMGAECPPFPAMSKEASDELKKYCFPRTDDTGKQFILCPATLAWLNKVDNLHIQLSRCGKKG